MKRTVAFLILLSAGASIAQEPLTCMPCKRFDDSIWGSYQKTYCKDNENRRYIFGTEPAMYNNSDEAMEKACKSFAKNASRGIHASDCVESTNMFRGDVFVLSTIDPLTLKNGEGTYEVFPFDSGDDNSRENALRECQDYKIFYYGNK